MAISHSLSRRMRADLPAVANRRAFAASMSTEQGVERALLDLRIVAQRAEQLLLAARAPAEVGLEVRAARDVGDLEQRQQRGVVLGRRFLGPRNSGRARTGPRAASACECARSVDARSGSPRGWGRAAAILPKNDGFIKPRVAARLASAR
jgi:hypothetical protein